MTSYVYDSQGQLLRENNQAGGFTHTWTYDNAGNILERKEYAYTTGSLDGVTPTDTIPYVYDDLSWGDLLTGFDGKTITSDAIGNMTAKGSQTYTWKHGRQLATMTNSGHYAEYTYREDGLRISKVVNGQAHTFTWIGDKIVQENYGDVEKKFFYDAEGRPDHFTYNGVLYYYVLNIMGDVTGVLDAQGNICGGYMYDAWGNVLSITGTKAATLGQINPLRYRGYVYDTETGFYYLQSRYYDPEIGRFISADAFTSTGQGLLGNNMFAYCNNSPSNKADSSGAAPYDLFDSPDEAAEDFANCYNAKSIADGEEYGSAIFWTYKFEINTVYKKFLFWTYKIVEIRKVRKYYYNTPAIGSGGNSVIPNLFSWREGWVVSTVHTHANYNEAYNNEVFSKKDKKGERWGDIDYANLFKMNIYVATPGGYLKKYTYKNRHDANGGVTIISSSIPWDPNSPDH